MPRIKTTRTARFALWALRIYLLILLTLIGIKFARMSKGSHHAAAVPPTAAPAPGAAAKP